MSCISMKLKSQNITSAHVGSKLVLVEKVKCGWLFFDSTITTRVGRVVDDGLKLVNLNVVTH